MFRFIKIKSIHSIFSSKTPTSNQKICKLGVVFKLGREILLTASFNGPYPLTVDSIT